MRNTPKYKLFQQVLDWCNKIRKQRGIEPPLFELPKGKQTDGYTCPCGTATGVFVGTIGYASTKEYYQYQGMSGDYKTLPSCVWEFVFRFDRGEFPELVDGPLLQDND